ncbi:MAG: hypothetical protein EAZ70_05745 [Runella slithyformis]|nr:MAG: hypothetical protein EAZ70_05745 [Runella slithyformis]
MKTNKIDLDLDFIGGEGSLTKTEEKELSDFFKSRKSSARATKPAPLFHGRPAKRRLSER